MEVQHKRLAVKAIMRQLGFDMEHFMLPEGDMVTMKQENRRMSVYVELPNGEGIRLAMTKERFDTSMQEFKDAFAEQVGTHYLVQHDRYFATEAEARAYMETLHSEHGISHPICQPIKTLTHQGKTFALSEINVSTL